MLIGRDESIRLNYNFADFYEIIETTICESSQPRNLHNQLFTNYTIPGKKQKQINPPYPFKNSQKKKKISPSLEKRRRKHRTRADFIRLECQQSLAATQECVCQIRRGISMASRCSAAAERRVCTRGRERVRGKRRQREGSVIGET